MPGGPVERTIVYKGPFECPDREHDYEVAWRAFHSRFIDLSQPTLNPLSIRPVLDIGELVAFLKAKDDRRLATGNVANADELTRFALIQALRVLESGADSRHVSFVAEVIRDPHFANPWLPEDVLKEWFRVVGQEAREHPATGDLDSEWGRQVKWLQKKGWLVDSLHGWSLKGSARRLPMPDWLVGRAQVGVVALKARLESEEPLVRVAWSEGARGA